MSLLNDYNISRFDKALGLPLRPGARRTPGATGRLLPRLAESRSFWRLLLPGFLLNGLLHLLLVFLYLGIRRESWLVTAAAQTDAEGNRQCSRLAEPE
jgi:hypothetical protein